MGKYPPHKGTNLRKKVRAKKDGGLPNAGRDLWHTNKLLCRI